MMLEKIIAQKRQKLAMLDLVGLTAQFKDRAKTSPPVKSLKSALTASPEVALIAEIKRRSPSKGDLNIDLDPGKMAEVYEQAGASAISVLTEEDFFGGSTDDLIAAKAAVKIPILRKDFILDEFQVWESRFIGADAILLIAAILSDEEIKLLYDTTKETGLEALIEVHSLKELERIIVLNPEIIGINNRNLDNFEVSLEMTAKLTKQIDPGIVRISESGIHTRDDMVFVEKHGVDAVLVGESIVTSDNPADKILNLLGRREAAR